MPSRRLLSIGTDRLLFQEGSAVRARQTEYAKMWDEVHIIVFAGRKFRETAIAPNCWVYPTRSWSKFLYAFDAIRLGRFIIKKRGMSEITCQDSSLTAMAGLALKKEFGIPVELQIHEDIGSPFYGYRLSNRIRKVLAQSYILKADSIRVVSERIKTYVRDVLGVAENKITVRPIAVDTAKIAATPMNESVNLRKKYPQFDRVVLMASRLESEKGIDDAFKAWQLVLRDMPRVGLVIVGSGSKEQKLKSLTGELGITASVVFENWTDLQTLISYYKTADIFLNTSLFEGYGMTLAEARAAGCRIISTDVGIAPEVGAHIVEKNPTSISEGIIKVLSSIA